MLDYQHLHQLAVQALLLGTHRRPLPAELEDAILSLGIDKELPQTEQLLELSSLLDRLRRLRLHPLAKTAQRIAPPPKESTVFLGPKSGRALELALGATYQSALKELLLLIKKQDALVPPHLIVELLELATTLQRAGQVELAEQFFQLTGQRGKWLAKQHPEWSALLPPEDFGTAYRRLVTPADKQKMLQQWRNDDPEAARLALVEEWPSLNPKQQESRLVALRTGLSAADIPFLQSALKPRRRDVRKLATRLLLLQGEATITSLFTTMAEKCLDEPEGRKISIDAADKAVLEDHGFWDKKVPPASLLANIPPVIWIELLQRSPLEAFSRLLIGQKKLFPALLDALVFYQHAESRLAICKYLLQLNVPQLDWTKKTYDLYAQLTAEEYVTLCEWGLKNVEQVFRKGSVLRQISLQLPYPWPDHFCKMLVKEFTDQLSSQRAYYGFAPNASWKLLPYRMDVKLFPWLRQQLFAATDRSDQMGSIATKMLQVVSFRKAAREAIIAKQ